MQKKLPDNIVNPFSEAFIDTWDNWKAYRWDEHKFKYKGVFSEQAALMELNRIAHGLEETAISVIKQSMAYGWKGFFELKNNGNGQQSTPKNGFTRSGVQSALDDRLRKRKQTRT